MYVITYNDQDYDSGGEYPIGYKKTKEEADTFVEKSNAMLIEWYKIKGRYLVVDIYDDIATNEKFKNILIKLESFESKISKTDTKNNLGETKIFLRMSFFNDNFSQAEFTKIVKELNHFRIIDAGPSNCYLHSHDYSTYLDYRGYGAMGNFISYEISELDDEI
jgi:hypothetical protein